MENRIIRQIKIAVILNIVLFIALLITMQTYYGMISNEIAGKFDDTVEHSLVQKEVAVHTTDFKSSLEENNKTSNPSSYRRSRFIKATWYGESDAECMGCRADRVMANGKVYDETLFTAAANFVPLNTLIVLEYNRNVIAVVVTDRMLSNTKIDLSKAAFQFLVEDLDQGVATVKYYYDD